MEKKLTLKQLITENILYETKYSYSQKIYKPKIGGRYYYKIETENAELILNPTIIFELDEFNELEFDTSDIFNSISYDIGGCQNDKLYSNQLKIYQEIEQNKIIKNGSKIIFPINFTSFNKNYGIIGTDIVWYDIKLYIEFTLNPCISCIKEIYLQTDLIITKTKPDYSKINKYYLDDCNNQDKYRYHQIQKSVNMDNNKIIKIIQTQFTGIDNIYPNLINHKIKINFNHFVEKFFIYFENIIDNSIYKNKPFDKIEFESNGNYIIEFDYETLINNNNQLIDYKLPRGVYQIDWDKYFKKNLSTIDNLIIRLYGIMVPNYFGFCIIGNSVNYINYENGSMRMLFAN